MKKPLFFIIALVVLLMAVLPYVTGRIAESATYHLAAQLNHSSEQYGEVKIENYERGFRSSDTAVSWQPGIKQVALAALVKEPIRLDCHGSHGLLSYSYRCTGQNLEAYREFVKTELDGVDPISISGEISLFGDITLTLSLNEFEVEASPEERIAFKSGSVDITTNKAAERFVFFGDFGGLLAVDEAGELIIEGVELKGDLKLNQFDIGIGSAYAAIESVTFSSPKDGVLKLNKLNMVAESNERGADLEMIYSLMVNRLQQSESPTATADAADLSQLLMEVSFTGINMAQLAVLNEKWMALPSDSGIDNNAAMLAMIPELEDLLKSGLTIDSRLAADYESEALSADFNFALVGDLTFGDFLLMKLNPKTFFSKFNAKLKTLIPESVLNLSPQTRASIAGSPLYVRSGSNYESHIELKDGDITINGNTMSLEQLLTLLNDR